MNQSEFVKICSLCGYASKKNALAYSEGKQDLTEDDLIEIYRLNERGLDMQRAVSPFKPVKISGSQLIEDLNKKPVPWNKTFDASRGWEEDKDEEDL